MLASVIEPLDVAFRRWPDHVHRMEAGDLRQARVVHVVSTQCGSEVVEVSDHRRWKVEVELPARDLPDLEAVRNADRDEDERPGGTGEFAVLQIHDVFAVEDVERL